MVVYMSSITCYANVMYWYKDCSTYIALLPGRCKACFS